MDLWTSYSISVGGGKFGVVGGSSIGLNVFRLLFRPFYEFFLPVKLGTALQQYTGWENHLKDLQQKISNSQFSIKLGFY